MIGTRLQDRYEIVKELGRGGMGVVYLARDPLLNREVAVKLLPSSLLTPSAEERFRREAQVVAQMDHPAVVSIFDIGRHEGSLFFVMPLVAGTTLRALIRERTLRLGDVLDVGIQVADALDYSHVRGVVHRDVKPENVMVLREEGPLRVKVMDFGLATGDTQDTRITRSGTLVGTICYFSPEQVSTSSVDARSDVYSLGTVIYECLTGTPPFTGEVQAVLYRIVHEIPQSPRSLGVEVDHELEDLVMRCLVKDPGGRPQRTAEVADGLRAYRAKLHENERARVLKLALPETVQLDRPGASPFVGREKEFAELQQRLHAALSGSCQLALVGGEAGVGKSRLVTELERLARARRVRVLRGRFVEQDRTFCYQGFCEVIQDHFRSRDPSGSSGEGPDLSDLAPELVTLFPVLTEIPELRAAGSGDRTEAGSRKTDDRIYVFELLARALGRLAAGKPLLLVLENLHAADVSVDALQYIVRRLGPTATLIVGTYRTTDVDRRHPLSRLMEAFADDPRFSSLVLGPLTASEHGKLVRSLLGSAAELPEDLLARLYSASEGNAFFVKELVRSLLETQGIVRDPSGAWTLSGEETLGSESMPATIQQAVERRIERLPDEVRDVLAVASVLGREFDYRDLEALAERGRDLDPAVERLVGEGYLEEERGSRGDSLSFVSGIVREVLYSALSRRRRRSLHRRFAEHLEHRHAGRLERIYPQLLHHYAQGDVAEKTVELGLKQGRRALEAYSLDDAAGALKTVLEYLDEEWAGERVLEAEARELLAAVHQRTGNLESALKEAETAVRVYEAERAPERALRTALFAAESAWQGRRVEEARRWVEKGLDLSRSAPETDTLRHLLSLAATVANLRGEHERAREYLERADRLGRGKAALGAEEEVASGGRLVVAFTNPVLAREPGQKKLTEESEVLANVFETLVATDLHGQLVPWLCREWSVLEGGRGLRLALRPDVRFSDGHPLAAADVKASFERAIRTTQGDLPAAFAAIAGAAELRAGAAGEASGLVVSAADTLEVRLLDPLPLYPALLTDAATAVVRGIGSEEPLGTGPFVLASRDASRIVLARNNSYWRGTRARLDEIEVRTSVAASAIADGFRSGDLDIARDLLPEDLESLLREPRARAGLVETAKKNTYFVLFRVASPPVAHPDVRRALAGVLKTHDLAWRSLGRFAQPATCIIPPGLLGHDAGRKRATLTHERALELLRAAGAPEHLRLRASVHPLLQDRYLSLTRAICEAWAELGVEVEVATPTMADHLASLSDNAGVDLIISRWMADYDDPDNFTFKLFHSKGGAFRLYFSSPETDELAEAARHETRAGAREALYRKFEKALLDAVAVVPLFHDTDYRIARPGVRGLRLRSAPPFVNYAEVAKTVVHEEEAPRLAGGGVVQVAMAATLLDLDPSLTETIEQSEVLPNVFETLTRDVEGARIVPWLASDVTPEEGGRHFRFRLREDVRFHDGRRLTARDVRWSFERLLQNRRSGSRWLLAPVRGSAEVIAGDSSDLAGFHILGPHELVLEMDKPLPLLPALLSYPAAAIVPEGAEPRPTGQGCVGTGPFRLASFEPGRRLELERNLDYWRPGLPRAEGLVFRFGMAPAQILADFRAGRLGIATDLFPADVEALRREAAFASGYREAPRLSTHLVTFNANRGPLVDVELRRRLVRAVDVPTLVRKTLARMAVPARGLIPPGLLGHDSVLPAGPAAPSPVPAPGPPLELRAAVHPVFFAEYSAVAKELFGTWAAHGFLVRPATEGMTEYMKARATGDVDMVVGRWGADYPDADSFARGVLHSRDATFLCGSPDIDVLIDRARSEIEPRVRHTLYRRIEEVVAREARLIPLFHEQVYRFARPEVEGLAISFSQPTVAYEQLRIRR